METTLSTAIPCKTETALPAHLMTGVLDCSSNSSFAGSSTEQTESARRAGCLWPPQPFVIRFPDEASSSQEGVVKPVFERVLFFWHVGQCLLLVNECDGSGDGLLCLTVSSS